MARVQASKDTSPPTNALILRFWSPLAATWLMMAAEGPFLAAIIARLSEPVHNLAAYGVALAIGFLAESPIIMMVSASTALVCDRESYRRLRDFSFAMNLAVTLLILLVLIPPVFDALTLRLLALPDRVAELTRMAVTALVPWPAAIGYRRFYHGILIAAGRTRLVAYGTVLRLSTIAATGIALYSTGRLPGAVVGMSSLSAGVISEAIAARVWARGEIRRLLSVDPSPDGAPLTLSEIVRFYAPLAMTPLINMAAQPMITFFVGRGRLPLESLAVLPVVHSFGFIFRCMALAYQEVVIALGRTGEKAVAALRRFAAGLGVIACAAMAAVVLSPLSGLWFEGVSGLTPSLMALAVPAALILVPTPGLAMVVAFRHARLVSTRRTGPITAGTGLEVLVIGATLATGMAATDFPAAFVAVAAILAGRLSAAAFLLAVGDKKAAR